MLKKKAQGLSITTIIVAVIGLIILVVIVMMITGKLGIFSEGIASFGDASKKCTNQVPSGTLSPDDKCLEGTTSILSSDASGQGKKCCRT